MAGADSTSMAAELETLVVTSRDLRRCVDEGNEDGVDVVLKDMLKFVNQIKEDPDLLEPESAASVITQEQTILTLALTLDNYVKLHSSANSMTNGHTSTHNLMRAVRVAQIVAEVAKIEVMRELCVECGIIPPLVAALDFCSKGELIRTHVCRAIGNICFDCNPARKVVGNLGGLEKLLTLMKDFLKDDDNDLTADDISKLRRMMAGCLLNLTNTYLPLQERSLEAEAIPLLDGYLRQFATDEDLVQTVLLCLGGLAESPRGISSCANAKIASRIVPLLDVASDDVEVTEGVLELLAQLAEDDDVKYELATETNCCDSLVKVVRDTIESPSFDSEGDEDRQSLGKLSSDLIVTLVTGDKSMEFLYAQGRGLIFQEANRWLSSTNEPLQTAGALVVGNFARNDENCKQLVHLGVAELLIGLLKSSPLEKSEAMQHAVLSTLRNLAIPLENKPILLEKGILGTVLPLSKSPTFQIQFKLLGLIRMLVDNQSGAALALGKNSVFVQLVVKWCGVGENLGIQSEAVRLLAWLIKNSRSKEVMEIVVLKGGFPFLASMIYSEHIVMQNEALISITLIFNHLAESQLLELTEKLMESLKAALTKGEKKAEEEESNPDGAADAAAAAKLAPETIANIFTLLVICGDHAEIKKRVKNEEEIFSLAKSYVDSPEEKIRIGAKSVMTKYA